MNFGILPFLILAGWLAGSLLNYLADVLPRTRRLSSPKCISCGIKVSLQNYLLLRKCNNCGAETTSRRRVVQALSTILIPIVFYFPPARFGFWLSLPYFLYFALVFIMDIEHRVVLYEVVGAGILISIPMGLYWNGWLKTILGGLTGFGLMFILYYFGVLFNRWMSKRRGEEIEEVALGFGDVNLSGVLGLLLGWPKIAISLFFSVVMGGVFSGLYLLGSVLARRYRPFTAIPYAPFLVIAAVILIYLA
ncbi:type 4 prepilin peptidase 1. Aspartic peptidase. MEROPS family A24A [Bellilinea caldifistulae]|uniref:prepilin peptidase n=1 Tax=Bellilinea caldifistulae TaxID=360411 RepID=UPI0009E646B5|nr:prepilin peptidase [Bellilinea caldifistulae]GAP10844.1 type 4 prepilin peptidase 1. Aspartic peptidase. MEROPS family A24A [Bellilinea caldifistulae]